SPTRRMLGMQCPVRLRPGSGSPARRKRGAAMTDRPHWSYSAIAQFLRCPLQFYFQRILQLPQPFTPSALVLGSCVHKALALYHRSLKDDQALEPDAIQQAFREAWRERKQQGRIL